MCLYFLIFSNFQNLLSTGYGDYTPITFLGRFAAVCTALFGIGAVALPAGILASAFTERKRKKD